MPSLFSGRGAEGWHAPAGRRTCEPRPLVQDGQIRPAVPVGAIKTWDPADRSFRRKPERRQPNRRSGRDPGSRPYARTTSKPGKPGRKHYPHSPCRAGSTTHTLPAEKGTHQELLRLDGTYARLWQHQSGGFLDDDVATAMLAQAPRLSA